MRFTLSLCVVFAACGAETGVPGDTDGVGSTDVDTEVVEVVADPFIEGRDCPEDTVATWRNFGEPLLLEQCTGCHSEHMSVETRGGAPEGVDFNTQALMQQWLDRIYARAGDENVTMPPVDTISAEDRQILGDWLACGAP